MCGEFQAWWHRPLQLVSEHIGAIFCCIPRLIFEEHIEQKTGFLSIGSGPELVSIPPEGSNNFEVSQISLEMEIGTDLRKDERKLGAEGRSWLSDKIHKFMVTGEIDRMREWCNDITCRM